MNTDEYHIPHARWTALTTGASAVNAACSRSQCQNKKRSNRWGLNISTRCVVSGTGNGANAQFGTSSGRRPNHVWRTSRFPFLDPLPRCHPRPTLVLLSRSPRMLCLLPNALQCDSFDGMTTIRDGRTEWGPTSLTAVLIRLLL